MCLNRTSPITPSLLVLCSLLYEFLSQRWGGGEGGADLCLPFRFLCTSAWCLSTGVFITSSEQASGASSRSHLACVFNNWAQLSGRLFAIVVSLRPTVFTVLEIDWRAVVTGEVWLCLSVAMVPFDSFSCLWETTVWIVDRPSITKMSLAVLFAEGPNIFQIRRANKSEIPGHLKYISWKAKAPIWSSFLANMMNETSSVISKLRERRDRGGRERDEGGTEREREREGGRERCSCQVLEVLKSGYTEMRDDCSL